MKRVSSALRDLRTMWRGWRAARVLRAETVAELADTVTKLQARIADLENDLDEFRSDSRRIAELRIQVEDFLSRS